MEIRQISTPFSFLLLIPNWEQQHNLEDLPLLRGTVAAFSERLRTSSPRNGTLPLRSACHRDSWTPARLCSGQRCSQRTLQVWWHRGGTSHAKRVSSGTVSRNP